MTSNKRKLVLHFDIRNTVLVADSITNVSIEESLNSYLTSVAWGEVDQHDNWSWHGVQDGQQPRFWLKRPSQWTQGTTYYKYLEKKYVKTADDRVNFRKVTGNFSQSDVGQAFQPVAQTYLKCLEVNCKNGLTTEPPATLMGRNGQKYHYLLPSFLKLIKHLTAENRDFATIFETYGLDASNVLNVCETFINQQFHDIASEFTIDKNICYLKRTDPNLLHLNFAGNGNHFSPLSDPSAIYNYFNTLHDKYFGAVIGDFQYWLEHDYHHTAGKPLLVDLTDTNTHHILFDDNFRADELDSIVDLRIKSEKNGDFEQVSMEEVAMFENIFMVQVDLLEAIKNENYFTDSVSQCEDNFLKWQNK